jgi:SAM-dependent methyltransferase
LARELGSLQGPLGRLLDVGCGRGQFSTLLYELGLASSVSGVDWDSRKVDVARLAAVEEGAYTSGDALTMPLPVCDTALLIDVLHYLPQAEQTRLLTKVSECLPVGGRLLLREVSQDAGAGGRLARFAEAVATATGYNRARRLTFQPAGTLVTELESMGYRCEVRGRRRPPWFLPNVLIDAEKVRAAAPPRLR